MKANLKAIFLLFLLIFPAANTEIYGAQKEPVKAEAFAGKPFGVGYIKVFLDKNEEKQIDKIIFELKERNGRIFYPVIEHSSNGYSYKRAYRDEEKEGHEKETETPLEKEAHYDRPYYMIYFLFKGNEKLELELNAESDEYSFSHKQEIEIRTLPEPEHKKTLAFWFEIFKGNNRNLRYSDSYPPFVENYLTMMFANRLGLKTDDRDGYWGWLFGRHADEIFGILLGTESIRIAMQRHTFLQDTKALETADQKIPEPAIPPQIEIPEPAPDVKIEPIAMQVPVECFYIRCGSFPNFRWLRQSFDDWGSMVRDVFASRGLDFEIKAKTEKQLTLKEKTLSKIFGRFIISDVAIIGTDTFLREGAAIGIIFEASKDDLLAKNLLALQQEAVDEDKEAKLQTVSIAGNDVSFVSTPDNRVRSFYAVSGKYHLVTNSAYIVRRFFDTAKGKGALGASKEFKHARTIMPLDREDTIYCYMSDPFFRMLVSPKYRVEMTRRMLAESDIMNFTLAQLAAKAEGYSDLSVKALIDGGFLPKTFNKRPDKSFVKIENGRVVDSLRGARGTFLPIPDVGFDRITKSEADSYIQFTEMYRNDWERIDPVIIALKRKKAGGAEQISIDFHITPYAKSKYDFLFRSLGQPLSWRPKPLPGSIASGIVSIAEGPAFLKELFTAFGNLLDFEIPFVIRDGRVYPSEQGRDFERIVRGYLALDYNARLEKDIHDYEIVQQYRTFLTKIDRFLYYSFHQDIIEKMVPAVKFERAERPAQVRLQMQGLAKSKMRTFFDAVSYAHSRRISAGNMEFLQMLSQQLHIPHEDCLATAEKILGAKPVCMLGGEYKLDTNNNTPLRWRSTMVDGLKLKSIPKKYRCPLIDWMLETGLEFNITETTISTHLELKLNFKAKRK